MKQFVRAPDKDGASCFKYISDSCSGLSEEREKMGIFSGLQIRQLIQDKNFAQSVAPIERDAWLSFASVIKNFLGNTKGDNNVHVVNDMLEKVKRLNLHMSIKIHFLFSHLERFPQNFGAVKDDKGKDFTKM